MNQGAAVEEDPQLTRARARIGMVLQDKWTVQELLGVGGMAAVYAATHRNGKRVAVKMLHSEMSHDPEVKQRFLQEGYAANTIQHEGAVSVMDDDVAPDGSAFIVMELLEGETVEQRWARKGERLDVREVLAIVEQLLDVLAAAHAKNVVHRDVKPENLFVTKAGQLKVLDFGIAKVFEAQRAKGTATKVGVVMGTPAFMAPEQARARWDEVDGRTDLWAVGATMFTLLTGRHVHEGVSGNEQLILSATTQAPSVSQVDANVPPAVGAIVDRARAFDRGTRWPDAASMHAAVSAALAALGGADAVVASQRRPATS
ncbi:MAG TPA: serine/threonine-protein kinase, partial [Polyangiaceae bacterium]